MSAGSAPRLRFSRAPARGACGRNERRRRGLMEGELLLDIGVGLFAGAVAWSIAALWLDDGGDSAWLRWTLVVSSAALCLAGHLTSGGLL